MGLSMDTISQLIWGSSCLFLACLLLIYDGIVRKDIRIICGLFISFLCLQSVASGLFIVNDYLSSSILSYINAAILTMSGNMFLIMSVILFLAPLHRNQLLRIVVIVIIPIIYIAFLIALTFADTDFRRRQAAYCYYFPSAVCAFVVIIILYIWFIKQKFIFGVYYHSFANLANAGQSIHEMANWRLLFQLALVAIFVAVLMTFLYPILVIYVEIIPDPYPGFTVRVIDSVIFLPLITPLIRNLDKLVEYSAYRVLQAGLTTNWSTSATEIERESLNA